MLGLTLVMEGEVAEGLRVLRDTVAMPEAGTYSRATLGYALARAGQETEARAIVEALEVEAATHYVSPVAMATILVGLGEFDRAIDWMERAAEDRRGWVAYLNVNPILGPVRGHARFDALVRRMQLP